MRYYSVSLRGPWQIRAFLALLIRTSMLEEQKRKPDNTMRRLSDLIIRVKHLFLADCKDSEHKRGKQEAWTEWEDKAQAGALSKLKLKVKRANYTWRVRWIDVSIKAEAEIKDLLARVAPTLQHLCLDQIMQYTPLTHIPTPLPVLVELTWRRRWPSYPDSDTLITLSDWLPSLQRLHIVATDQDCAEELLRIRAMGNLPRSLLLVRFSCVPCPTILLSVLAHSRTDAWASRPGLKIAISSVPLPSIYDYFRLQQQLEPTIPELPVNAAIGSNIITWRDASPTHQTIARKAFVVEDQILLQPSSATVGVARARRGRGGMLGKPGDLVIISQLENTLEAESYRTQVFSV
jgi:hypothetical protein